MFMQIMPELTATIHYRIGHQIFAVENKTQIESGVLLGGLTRMGAGLQIMIVK